MNVPPTQATTKAKGNHLSYKLNKGYTVFIGHFDFHKLSQIFQLEVNYHFKYIARI